MHGSCAKKKKKKKITNPTCITVFSVTLCHASISSHSLNISSTVLNIPVKKLNEIYIVSLT